MATLNQLTKNRIALNKIPKKQQKMVEQDLDRLLATYDIEMSSERDWVSAESDGGRINLKPGLVGSITNIELKDGALSGIITPVSSQYCVIQIQDTNYRIKYR